MPQSPSSTEDPPRVDQFTTLGIAEPGARTLANYFESVEAAVAASPAELLNIPGIGEATIENLAAADGPADPLTEAAEKTWTVTAEIARSHGDFSKGELKVSLSPYIDGNNNIAIAIRREIFETIGGPENLSQFEERARPLATATVGKATLEVVDDRYGEWEKLVEPEELIAIEVHVEHPGGDGAEHSAESMNLQDFSDV